MPRGNQCCYVILKLALFAVKSVLIIGLFQNITETPNLVKIKVTIFGLYIKMPYAFMLLYIYCVNIWFFLCLFLAICKVNFQWWTFLTMVLLHFIRNLRCIIQEKNKVFCKVNTGILRSLPIQPNLMGPEIYPLHNFTLKICAELWV